VAAEHDFWVQGCRLAQDPAARGLLDDVAPLPAAGEQLLLMTEHWSRPFTFALTILLFHP
jgi:hypothetical protein